VPYKNHINHGQFRPKMTKKYKIVYIKKDCIGAVACENVAPEHWEYLIEKQIATLKSPEAKKTDEREELIIEEKDFPKHLAAAEICPANVIEIYELDTGKKVYPEE
tara:strand:- start:544 stop:861 length:318 start_codon:yes stop_codon:yes gene_type:complete